jgi:hypothetical protein
MQKTLIPILLVMLLQGCTLGYQKFYNQLAPEKYPETSKAMIFSYSNIDLQGIYETFFSDFIIIGKSSFEGPQEDPTKSYTFTTSIGADVLLTSIQFSNTATSVVPLVTPSVSTTNVSGFAGRTSFFGTATSYGTNTSYIPITVNRYNQTGLYLRKFSPGKPAWELSKKDLICSGETEFNGTWRNENYEMLICKAGEKIIGTLTKKPEGPDDYSLWKTDDVKLMFNPEDKKGVYFMSTKAPYPASFTINKFGHLEVTLFGQTDKFSFSKQAEKTVSDAK